jgi:hypothetical protein
MARLTLDLAKRSWKHIRKVSEDYAKRYAHSLHTALDKVYFLKTYMYFIIIINRNLMVISSMPSSGHVLFASLLSPSHSGS